MTILIFLQHHELHELRLHRIYCSYTKNFHVVPMIQGRPSKNRVCSVDFYRPMREMKVFLMIKRLVLLNLTHHVITSAILFNCHVTLWTFFRIGSNPVRCLRIIITFLYPLSQQAALNRIVPLLATFETKNVSAFALNRAGINVLDLHGVAAVG